MKTLLDTGTLGLHTSLCRVLQEISWDAQQYPTTLVNSFWPFWSEFCSEGVVGPPGAKNMGSVEPLISLTCLFCAVSLEPQLSLL